MIYHAQAKMGVIGLTRSVAREWGAFNIRANALVFGYIATRLVGDKDSQQQSIKVGRRAVFGMLYGVPVCA